MELKKLQKLMILIDLKEFVVHDVNSNIEITENYYIIVVKPC